MPWDVEKSIPAAVPEKAAKPDEQQNDRECRHAARRLFNEAPPYRIEFDAAGAAVLCQKFYEYWPNLAPQDATRWRAISRHQNLEEAERRLRLICGGPIYYDSAGRVLANGPRQKPRWDLPPTDDE